ncbi:MAG: DUF4139 domain-containing protein [Myxococcales bacterium]
MKRGWILFSIIAALTGCAGGPAVRGAKHVPVRNVVLYRSGVGYFERSGKFEGDSLEFQVKQDEVGDFLSSLTAIERSSGGVRSVSFDVPDAPEPGPSNFAPDQPQPAPAPAASRERVDVKLALSGEGQHDVSVAYVVGSPIWRPSYRVVLDGQDKALLQAWAVVQNTSGEDWSDINLSLTTGAPISFRSDLGTPIRPERPLVSDSGEVIAVVPVAETAVAQEPPPPPAPMASEAASMAPMMEEAERDDYDMARSAGAAAPEASKKMRSRREVMAAPKPAAPAMSAAALAQSVRPAASFAVLGDSVTRYDIQGPVTVPDGGSTMVALVSQRVPGEQAHLFAPEPGVPLSMQHPFSVVRLANATGAVLEKGPLAVLSNGAFLGQGVLDTLPRDAHSFVPFALDKTVVVEPEESYSEEQGALVRVQRNLVTVQRFSQRKTRYRVRNGGAEASKIYVRHPRWGQAELLNPPSGSELTPGKALVPTSVPGKGQTELEIIERTAVQMDFVFMDQPAADAIAVWLSGPAANDPQSAALKQALELRGQLVKVQEQLVALEREQAELANSADETRRNLRAIEKVKSAQDLRTRLVDRLRQLDTRLGELTKLLVETRTRQSELEVRLNESLDGVSLEAKP